MIEQVLDAVEQRHQLLGMRAIFGLLGHFKWSTEAFLKDHGDKK
jgi:hypothetical protein